MSANDIDLIGQKAINTEQAKLQGAIAEGAAIAEQRRSIAASGQWMAEANARRAQEDLESLKLHYQLLLAKPMHQIAELSGDFRKTYEESQYQLAIWVLSQKSFKELAYRYGELLGKKPSEVRADTKAVREDVLTGCNPPRHIANAGGLIRQFEQRLRSNPPGSEFQADYDKFCEEGRIHRLGETYDSWSDALDTWLEMAEGGNPAACYNVGRCFDRGDGTDRVLELAEHWYLRAHELGDPLAAYNLHGLYSDDKPDPAKAAAFIEESERRGDPRGIERIGKWRAEEAARKARSDLRQRLQRAIDMAKENGDKVRSILCNTPRITSGDIQAPVIGQVAEVDPILADNMRCYVGAVLELSETNGRKPGVFSRRVADVKLTLTLPLELRVGSLAPEHAGLKEMGCAEKVYDKNPVDSDLFDLARAVYPAFQPEPDSLTVLTSANELSGKVGIDGMYPGKLHLRTDHPAARFVEVPEVKSGTRIEGVKVTFKGYAFAVMFEKPVEIRGI